MLLILLRSFLLTLAVIAVSQSVCYVGLGLIGERYDAFTFWMSTIIPSITAFPVSSVIFWQQRRTRMLYRDLQRAHALLAHRAATDGLTGLRTREAFFDEMRAKAEPEDATGALLAIDVDHFKRVNDAYGHHAGDEALRLLAQAFRHHLPPGGVAARIGGEEFAIYLPGTAPGDAVALAERIRRAAAAIDFRPAHGGRHRLTVSVGIAQRGRGQSFDTLLRTADARLYRAKRQGRNTVVAHDGDAPPPRPATRRITDARCLV